MAETKQRQHEILLEIIAELRKIASRSFEDSHQRERALKEAAILIGDAYDADAFSVGFANVNEWVRWMREKGPKQPYFSIACEAFIHMTNEFPGNSKFDKFDKRMIPRRDIPQGIEPEYIKRNVNAWADLIESLNQGAEHNSLEQLEKEIPPFDRESGEWVSAKKAASMEEMKARALNDDRYAGQKHPDGSLGKDREGRAWRRPGTPRSHPWYLKRTLRSGRLKKR